MRRSSCTAITPAARKIALRSQRMPNSSSSVPTASCTLRSGMRASAGPNTATTPDSSSRAAAQPSKAPRHPRTTATASTTVSASTNSTSEARNAAVTVGPTCVQLTSTGGGFLQRGGSEWWSGRSGSRLGDGAVQAAHLQELPGEERRQAAEQFADALGERDRQGELAADAERVPENHQTGFLHAHTRRHDEGQMAYRLGQAFQDHRGAEVDGVLEQAQHEPDLE